MDRPESAFPVTDVAHFRRLLLSRLSEIAGTKVNVEDEIASIDAIHGRLRIPRDKAEMGSEHQIEQVLHELDRTERQELEEILAAIERTENGSYGLCERTGRPIPRARLEAIPWARFTVEAAREYESETGAA